MKEYDPAEPTIFSAYSAMQSAKICEKKEKLGAGVKGKPKQFALT
jgi:hypothetical protein